MSVLSAWSLKKQASSHISPIQRFQDCCTSNLNSRFIKNTYQKINLSETKRLTLEDGGQIDVLTQTRSFIGKDPSIAPFINSTPTKRSEVPDIEVQFGYNLGPIGWAGIWYDDNGKRSEWRVTPVGLPQAPMRTGLVQEFLNTTDYPGSPGGHYFYTMNSEEIHSLESGVMGKWVKTGKVFYSGGYVSTCRFYGSVSPGPNSHFFSSDATECDKLKSLQISPTPKNTPQWHFEGKGFDANTPIIKNGVPICVGETVPVYRAYNLAFSSSGKKNPWDSNHRFSTERSAIAEVVEQGWIDEGVVFCVAPL